MSRKKRGDLRGQSFTISIESIEKLRDLSHKEGLNKSEMLDKIISEYQFISFDVKKEQEEVDKQIALEKATYLGRIKELEQRRDNLNKIGKQKKILDKVMSSKKEEVIEKIVKAFERKSSFEGIELIAKEGQRECGIDARDLISEAIQRGKN